MATNEQAVLVYDGDCGICAWWVRYWQRLTGDRVRYGSYQQIAGEFPSIPEQDFAGAIHLFGVTDAGGTCGPRSGAQAAFTLLAMGGRWFPFLLLYRVLPGFATLSEWIYASIAAHRPMFARLSWLLWGHDELQVASHDRVAWLLLRLLGLWFLAAFVAFAVQAQGLIGSGGILPVQDLVAHAEQHFAASAWVHLPTLFLIDASDTSITALVWSGVLLSLLVVLGYWVSIALSGCVVLYLSLFHAGQVFMGFQWDRLLIECGVLGLLLSLSSGRLRSAIIWLWRWLLFRFMLLSGVVKITSGDSAWWDLTALQYHFETQPLPTAAAWFAHQLPPWLLQGATLATLVIELLAPFLLLLPRRVRFLAAGLFASLQLCIIITGNYNWFNLLSLTLCIAALDDQALAGLLPRRLLPLLDRAARHRRGGPRWLLPVVAVLAAAQLLLSSALLAQKLTVPMPDWVNATTTALRPFALASNYGPFAVMTRARRELVIEGSADGLEWKPYHWRYKPDREGETGLPWIIPYQPRLDWQAWFVVLGPPRASPWLNGLLRAIAEGRRPALQLFADNPFSQQPPRWLRLRLQEYRFSTAAERARTGHWWVSRPPVSYLKARLRR